MEIKCRVLLLNRSLQKKIILHRWWACLSSESCERPRAGYDWRLESLSGRIAKYKGINVWCDAGDDWKWDDSKSA